jgi:hypothetical protein
MQGDWQNKLNALAMPLSSIQTDILRLLAAHATPKAMLLEAHH